MPLPSLLPWQPETVETVSVCSAEQRSLLQGKGRAPASAKGKAALLANTLEALTGIQALQNQGAENRYIADGVN